VNTRYDTERDLRDLHESGEQDREISLGTTTILGIFFALALLCALFFGFGYSMGRKSALPVAGPSQVTTGSESNASKPSPDSPAATTSSAPKPSAGETQSAIVPLDSPNPAVDDSQPVPVPAPVKAVASNPRLDVPAEPVTKPASKPVALVPVAATTPSLGSSVVQVAAMSHQEDADVVAVDLKHRGYTVAIRREPQDKLFHVQIGPFATRKESDAMRQRLQTDGYNNAIVK
jgi:cell division septation protein DedD